MQAVKVIAFITALVIVAFHIGSSFAKEKIAKIFSYANLALHLVLFFELMALKASLELLALCFMISLFLKLLSSFVSYKTRGKGDDVK